MSSERVRVFVWPVGCSAIFVLFSWMRFTSYNPRTHRGARCDRQRYPTSRHHLTRMGCASPARPWIPRPRRHSLLFQRELVDVGIAVPEQLGAAGQVLDVALIDFLGL